MKSHAAETGGASGPWHRFAAPLSGTVVGLELPPRASDGVGPASAVLDAADALASAEPVLRAVEDWLACGLLPAPTAADAVLPFDRHLALTHPATGAVLHLPLSVLRGAGPPPAELLGAWRWNMVDCALVLDAIALTPADADGLRGGAVVLLPAAFAPQWQGRLLPAEGRGGAFGAHLYEQRGRLCVAALGQPAPVAPPQQVLVQLRHRVPVPPPQLLGWTTGKPAALDAPQLTAVGAIVLQGPDRTLATGQLMPVGSGFAVRIDAPLPTTIAS